MKHPIENDISILSMLETNLYWSQTTHKEQYTNLIYTFYKHHKIIQSTSHDKYLVLQNGFKTVGNAALLLNHITSQTIKKYQDLVQMRRWLCLALRGKRKKKPNDIIIYNGIKNPKRIRKQGME